MSTVAPPFTVRWTTSSAVAPSFAVFVDQAPIPSGHDLRDLADTACKLRAGCPDAVFLANHGVYITASDHVDITSLVPLGGVGGRAAHPVHSATLVALDGSQRRQGEASWTVEFRD
jgi:hypothetical protein